MSVHSGDYNDQLLISVEDVVSRLKEEFDFLQELNDDVLYSKKERIRRTGHELSDPDMSTREKADQLRNVIRDMLAKHSTKL